MFRIFKLIQNKITSWCLDYEEVQIGEFHKRSNPINELIDDHNGTTKFIETSTSDYLVETPTGFSPINRILKTIEYQVFKVSLENGMFIECADEHILMSKGIQYYAKDLIPNESYLDTIEGESKVIGVEVLDMYENMYDLDINDDNKVYYTNGILSHNTTIVAGYILHYMIFNSEKNVAIVAHQRDQAQEILERIQRAFEVLPLWLQPGVRVYNKTSMRFDNGSKCLAAASTSSGVRGKSFSLLYVDEMAFIDDIDKFWKATYPTVSSKESSQVIITSTPNGMGNLYHSLWLKANHRDEKKRSTFIPYMIDWQALPRKNPEQWRQDQINNTSEEDFRQEYCCLNPISLLTLRIDGKIRTMSIGELYKLLEIPINNFEMDLTVRKTI